ncbi:MAG: 2,3,4,5-tetrahydropyridine-2,6-dicarboxylate N-succinyltransferase [Candidatus Cloacimonetes bacterium]|nr:2,3,4,5-tetrahydropyridine-2,6-dicarboxylate N-succinyltransferase [Candidatus Cloacimonadota bacterium]
MTFDEVLDKLESGELRSANKNEKGQWEADIRVKHSILEAFKAGASVAFNGFVDKDTLMPREFTVDDGVRLVPGGSSVRRGAYVAKGVIIMPPAYINVGAYVDEGSMVDSHALVGSCAQIGKHVHLSAGVQIGGVLEPIGMAPVVLEDNVFVGAGSVIVEGIVVRERAVIAPGVTLSRGVSIYDAVNNEILERGADVPTGAVVVSGTRPFNPSNKWANVQGLQLNCPIIIKYRDDKSDASLTLEEALR